METNNIELINSSLDLFSTSTPLHKIANYGLDPELLTNNDRGAIQYDRVLFIDSAIEDYQTLIDNLSQPIEVVILDSQRDGIVQITESLSKYDSLT